MPYDANLSTWVLSIINNIGICEYKNFNKVKELK